MDAPAPAPVPPAPPAPPALPAPLPATSAVSAHAPASPYHAVPASPYAVAPYAAAPAWAQPAPKQNVLAWVAFGLGLGGMLFGIFTTIPAIVCGHIARRQIRDRGEAGGAAALTGLIAGYVLTAIMVLGIGLYLLLLVFIFAAAGTSTSFGSSI